MQQIQTAPIYDLAITGGGLAGLTLAIQAADAGYTVVLFEKERYPFHKVCGEYISMESWRFLENCGVPLSQWNLPQIKRLSLSDCTGKQYSFQLPLGGFGVSRYQLDAYLADVAKLKGVHLFTDTKVTDIQYQDDRFEIETASGVYLAKVATASYGKRTNLDIKWKRDFTQRPKNRLNNYIGVKYHINYPFPDDLIALHNFKDGYCGISRIEDDKCCLCYLTTAENLAKSGNKITTMEEQVLSANPQLKEIFTNATHLYDGPQVISQISFDQKTQVDHHLIMLGDAAGLITPLCGNGMSMAMHASVIVFDHIHAFLSGKIGRTQMEEQYVTAWKQQFAKRLFFGRLIQKCFGNPFLTALFLKAMHTIPSLAKWLIRQTHGRPF